MTHEKYKIDLLDEARRVGHICAGALDRVPIFLEIGIWKELVVEAQRSDESFLKEKVLFLLSATLLVFDKFIASNSVRDSLKSGVRDWIAEKNILLPWYGSVLELLDETVMSYGSGLGIDSLDPAKVLKPDAVQIKELELQFSELVASDAPDTPKTLQACLMLGFGQVHGGWMPQASLTLQILKEAGLTI